MARTLYDGYGITELRRAAAELQVPGRSKMSGEELLTACYRGWSARRVAKENALIEACGGKVLAGMLFAESCGCMIRATTAMLSHVATSSVRRARELDVDPYPLFVRGEYVRICTTPGHYHGGNVQLDNRNRAARGEYGNDPYRFMLHNLRVLTEEEQRELLDELIPATPLNPEPVYCGSDSAHPAHDNCGGSTVDVPPIPEHSDGRFEIGQRIATMRATLNTMVAANRRTAPAPLERDNHVAGRMREAANRDRLYLDDARALLLDAAREIERLQHLAADQDEFCRDNMPELYR